MPHYIMALKSVTRPVCKNLLYATVYSKARKANYPSLTHQNI